MHLDAASLQQLDQLLSSHRFLHLSFVRPALADEGEDDGPRLCYVLEGVGLDGRRVIHQSGNLGDLLQAAQGEPAKACSRCGQVKPVSQFPRKPGVTSGRAAHCRVCDRERMRDLYPRAVRGTKRGSKRPPAESGAAAS